MVRSGRRLGAVAVLSTVALAACSGGGSGHRARPSRATSTSASTSTTVPSTTTTITMSPAGPSSTTAPAPHGGVTPSTARPGSVPSPQASCIAETPQELTGYLGRSLAGAQALAASQGYHVRVVGSDGTCASVSTELDAHRVDVYLDRGVVTAAGMG